MNSALLSRAAVYVLQPLSDSELAALFERAREESGPVGYTEGAKKLIESAARLFDRGERCDLEAAMAKLAGSEAGVFCSQEAMRIFGGYSLSVEYEIERFYRDSMLMVIGEGTNEILRQVIAKQLVGRYKI